MPKQTTAPEAVDLIDVQENDKTKRIAIILPVDVFQDLRPLASIDADIEDDTINKYIASIVVDYVKAPAQQEIIRLFDEARAKRKKTA